MKQHNYYFRHSITPFLVLCLMMAAAILRGQTQYIGASGGDWSTATNWNNGLPSAINLPTITGDGSVCINGTLTIDYAVTNFGAIINKGAVTLTGSINSGGTLENQGSFDINLGASMTSGGGFTNSGTLNNKGNVISNSAFVNTGSGFFNNTATWAQYGTFLNDGVFGNNAGSFTCTSDFTNNSTVENGSAATWKMDFGSSFTNNLGSTLTNLGSFQNIGTFTNNTTVTNSGLFTNNATHNCNGIFNNESGGQLVSTATVNMAGRLNNKVGASVTSSNIFNILANGYVSNLGQFTNSNMIDIKDTGTFCVETGATLTGNYGSTITNVGYFKVALSATVTTNGTITNNGKADIYGLYDAMNGGNIFNASLLCSYGSVKNVNVIDNSGVWKNLGVMENNSGGVWTNTGTVDNFKGATISNNYEIRNKPTGIINNNGTFNNNIRLYNEGLFTNNAYFVSSGAILNLVGGTFLNTEVLVIREGSIQNEGILTNEKTVINESCSTISNKGTINNTGRFENKGILFQRGTVSGNAILQLSGYVHTATNSNAPAICKTSLITGTDVNCDAKVYGQSGFVTTLDIGECNGFQYTANGVARYLYHAIHIGTPQTTHFKIITQTGDSLTCDVPTTVFDNVSPVVNNCPRDATIYATQNTATYSWPPVTGVDNCGDTPSVTESTASGSAFPIGTTKVTVSVKDSRLNSTDCVFNVNVIKVTTTATCPATDVAAPVFANCPTNQTITSSNTAAAAVWNAPSVTDNCYPVLVQQNFNSGTFFPIGTHTVTYTAKDPTGNIGTCSFTVTVNGPADICTTDNIKPIIVNCPPNFFGTLNPAITGAVGYWKTPTATDNCGGAVALTGTAVSGTIFNVGTTNVIYTATDAKNNTSTCSFTVSIEGTNPCSGDITGPALTCPANATVNTTNLTAPATWTAPTPTDACSPVTLNGSHKSGDIFANGTTTVTYSASDKVGNTSKCTFNVNVVNPCLSDTTAPKLTACSANQTITTAGSNATATWTAPTATDNCTLAGITSNYASGASLPIGTTNIIYTATDIKGNQSTCSFSIVVNQDVCLGDVTAPSFGTTCPTAAKTGVSTNGACVALNFVAPTATDNCGTPSVTGTHASNFCFPVGTTTVTYTATDTKGNKSTCSFPVTISNANPAPVSCTGNLLANFSFESDLTSYDNWGATVITTNARSGSKAAVVGTAAGGFGQDIAAVPYATYTFKTWNKIAGTVTWAGYGIDFYDAAWKQLSTIDNAVTATSFTEGSISAVAPANTAFITVWVWKDGTTGTMTTDDWCLTSVAPVCPAISTTKTYRLVNKLSGKVLGLEGLNTANNTYINQYTYNTTPNMQWQFSLNADGSYKVINRYSNDILACHSATIGARVYQWQNINDNAKYWVLENKGNCEYRLKNVYSGKYLDNISNGSTEGGQIGIASAGSGADQLWRIEEVTAAPNCFSAGSIAVDRWSGVNWAFPIQLPTTTPTLSTTQGNTQGPWNVADNYMSRVRGYICPQQTGSYQFNVTGDDNVELFLSTNSMAGSMTRVAYIQGWTSELEYSKFASQTSSTITLQANQIYYFELRHAEGSGGDGWRISWKTPSTTTWQPIQSQFLARSCNTTYKSASQAVFEFSAKADNRVAKLKWISNGGLNNDFYAVEKADEAGTFQHLSTINAATGNDAPTIFDYTDESPSEGDNHYRIKTVDNNGTPQYSAVKTINFKDVADAKVYPNPANDVLNIDLKSFEGLRVDIQLFNAMGKMITVSHVDKATATSYQVSTSEMPVGSYLVRIMPEGKREVTKQVKIAR